jgi:hypothetical protein
MIRGTDEVRRMLLREPDLGIDEIEAKLERRGFHPLSRHLIGTVKRDFNHIVRLLHEERLIDVEALRHYRTRRKKKRIKPSLYDDSDDNSPYFYDGGRYGRG